MQPIQRWIPPTITALSPSLLSIRTPSVTTSVPSASRRVYADAVRQLMLHNTIIETPMEAVAYPSSVVSSIEEALADGNETPAEYYNFSGMRVGVNPPPGVYIRRRGTVVDNVVIRQ